MPTNDVGMMVHLILMQFTGLKDKNGKEIYEGDIVIHGNNTGVPKRQYIIEWKDGMFICQYSPKDETDYEMSYVDDKDNHKALRSYASFNGAIIEVIGNIYEKSEELKTTEEMTLLNMRELNNK